MAEYNWDYGVEYEPEYWAGGSPTFDASAYSAPIGPGMGWDFSSTPAYQQFTGWGDPTGVGSSGDTSGGNWWNSVLGGLGQVGSFLGQNAGVIGPLVGAAGSLAGGAIGSNAAQDASRLQADALNRGIDLQTAQWLQQQQNLAPYLQAGQQGLSTLQGLAGREQPGLPGATPGINAANYALPSATPGWSPQTYGGYTPGAVPQAGQYGYQGPQAPNAGDYRWQPGQGPQAANYRYTPGQTPDAAAYRYTPGAVPTLSGTELLANDPGVQFRMDEGRKALEASAAARGGLLSGGTLAALQRQGQELGSQEYGAAWNRASQQAQMREGWAQQAGAQNFGQAMSAAQLREQVNQMATQQGWSQAQAEATFREAMASQASQQGFSQALGAQGQQWQQGMAGQQFDWQRALQEAQQREQAGQFGFGANLQAQQLAQQERQKYEADLYNRQMGQQTLRYGQDVAQNQLDYERQQALYRQQLGQHLLPWEQSSTLAGLGQKATGTYGEQSAYNSRGISDLLAQLGTAQGVGQYGSGLSQQRALTGAVNQIPSLLASLNA